MAVTHKIGRIRSVSRVCMSGLTNQNRQRSGVSLRDLGHEHEDEAREHAGIVRQFRQAELCFSLRCAPVTAPLCPRDATPLTVPRDVFGPGTKAQVCPKCTGLLVDGETGQKLFTSLGLSLVDLQTMVRHAEGKPRTTEPLACTSCEFRALGVP